MGGIFRYIESSSLTVQSYGYIKMSALVTRDDLRRFASVGYPAPVRASGDTEPKALAKSVVHVLESPAARLEYAAALAVKSLAQQNKLEVFAQFELSDDARRRLGYLAERCAQGKELSSDVGQRLVLFGARLHRSDDSSQPPLTFMVKANPRLLHLVAERADALNSRWNVYGDV